MSESDEVEAVRGRDGEAPERPGPRVILASEHLTWGYAGPLADPLCLAVPAGEAVALVGPNGAGKSSLLRALAGLLAPLSGRVLVEGVDLGQLPPARRARLVTLLPQEDLTDGQLGVRELVELGRTPYLGPFGRRGREDERAVQDAIALAGLEDLACRPLHQLSGGERQRARMAMALAQETRLLLLDEPTSHLNLRRRHELFQLLGRLRRQRNLAMVMVLHDLVDAYREADRVIVLHEGTIEEVSADDPQRVQRLARAFDVPEERIPG